MNEQALSHRHWRRRGSHWCEVFVSYPRRVRVCYRNVPLFGVRKTLCI